MSSSQSIGWVAETLERRWNAAHARVQTLEERLGALAATAAATTPPDRTTLLQLAEDFPRVWTGAATDMRLKKRIVRLLIEEIVVSTDDSATPHLVLIIHWTGGQHTRLVIPRNRTGQHRYRTDRAIVDVVRELAKAQPDQHIARILNRLGYRTGAGHAWTQSRVAGLRSYQHIPVFDRGVDRQALLTMAEAATRLGVSPTTGPGAHVRFVREAHRAPAPAAADRCSQKSSKRPLSRQQRKAMIASAPETVQRIPARLSRVPMTTLQPASTTPEDTHRPWARNSG